jgi:hypothetical protein
MESHSGCGHDPDACRSGKRSVTFTTNRTDEGHRVAEGQVRPTCNRLGELTGKNGSDQPSDRTSINAELTVGSYRLA